MKTDKFFEIKQTKVDLQQKADREILELLLEQDFAKEAGMGEEHPFIIVSPVSPEYDTILMSGMFYSADEGTEPLFISERIYVDKNTNVVFLD